ncbi:hypothetical protein C2845_PM04G08700 [Panicum miliaceum]|uniref:DUF1618 domain-containing protein n=1 Tax=Panicum miliaceum TaxID=4540 RepID=A0A3L6QQK7_PANMI|nr:hypothetical protein C2845_PM04G08700 [Panicum miliaceum]
MSWSTTVASVAGGTYCDLLARHAPTKVVSVGGVGLGWVDLRRGVLLCNVADERPKVCLVQLPLLLPTNRADFGEGFDGATPPLRQIRDVTCSDGLLRFIEIEYPNLDDDNLTTFRWAATMFARGSAWELGPVLHR